MDELLCNQCVPARPFKSRQGLAGHERLVHGLDLVGTPAGLGSSEAGDRIAQLEQKLEILEDLVKRAYQEQRQHSEQLHRLTLSLQALIEYLEGYGEGSPGLGNDAVLVVRD